MVASAEKEPAVAERKEVPAEKEPAVAEQKEVATEVTRADALTAKVAERPMVEAPGKADTVKMGIKVVGGDTNTEKPQVQRYE